MGTCTHTEVYKYINMCVVCVHVLLRCDAGAMMPNEFKTNMELSNGAVSGSSGSTPALENGVAKAKAKAKAKSEPKAKNVPKPKTPEQEAKAVSLLKWWVWTSGTYIYESGTPRVFGHGTWRVSHCVCMYTDNYYIYIYIKKKYAVNSGTDESFDPDPGDQEFLG